MTGTGHSASGHAPVPPGQLVCAAHEMLDSLQCGALLVERSGRILHANPRFCELAARPRDELVGQNVLALGHDAEQRAAIQQHLEQFSEPTETDGALPLPGGEVRPIVLGRRPLGSRAPLSEFSIVTVMDVSRLKAAEAESRERYREVARLSDTVLEQALSLRDYSKTLEEKVRQRTAELREANLDSIYMLAVASEAKDFDTGRHVRRIQAYSAALAEAVGMPADAAERIGYSAILHDFGKMHVPDAILKKPGTLTAQERRQIQQHTVLGERMLSDKAFFGMAREIARGHHENWDGSGYPDGRRQADIPLAARIVRVVDVFDALASPRVYKPAWTPAAALAEVCAYREKWFDPALVDAFEALAQSGSLEAIRAGQ